MDNYKKLPKRLVTVSVCSFTSITFIPMHVTKDELAFLKKLAKESKKRQEFLCDPYIAVEAEKAD